MIQKLVNWFMRTSLYNFVLSKIVPFIRTTTYYPEFPGRKYVKAYAILQPGDVIYCDDDKKLTSFLIPGKVAHVAMCVDKGDDAEYEVAEFTHTNFTKSFFFDVAKESTWLAIGRPQVADGYKMKVIDKMKTFEPKKYDNQFDNSDEKESCSESIYDADFEKLYGIEPEYLPILGRSYPTPDAVYKAKNIKIIWDSDNA
jgi:hypothetical protein